ncbi:MarR family winged helix-turn-helix transcriptional regulator [Vagococcus intermedius]|uniref:MarR family transcriptional regulator n=1 Tax=Vagococcus intermedius TaxID=2991418 RepID=A0AAF0CT83_9ENTE|nr:MarR family transcriptional regulator [Vagococcus intermedius]WEG72431.1 MarR family transcriptional regulator [Vagococcus intermedius]WEG74518.1 MarR family transcriptional regulator [Vagococcus intermedius]
MFDLTDCIGFIAKDASKTIVDEFNKRLKKNDISNAQWTALFFIGQSNGLSQKELGAKTNSKESSIARLLDRMEQDELCKRIRDPKDRRIIRVSLTPKGEKIRSSLLPIGEKFHQDAIRNISDDELATFKKVLDRMVLNLVNTDEN